MPFLSASACIADACAEELSVFPVTAPSCTDEVAAGGINELYFIPCSEVLSEANVTSLTWWSGLQTGNKIGRSGLGIGSIGKTGTTTIKVASCRAEQLTSISWALRFTQRLFDKTSARSHVARMNALIKNFQSFVVVARMCDGADTVLPIGTFTTSDVDWIVPENSEDSQNIFFQLSWKELGMPKTVDVAGLSTVIPKLA